MRAARDAVKLTGRGKCPDCLEMRRLRLLLLASLVGCNDGLRPTPVPTTCPAGFVGACGTITFRGAVPDSTDALYLVAYAAFPRSASDLFTFVPFPPPTLPLPAAGDSTVHYTLPLPDGQYQWVLAVWKKVGTLNPADTASADSLLREAGYYRDPADTTRPGVVSVNAAGTDHVDFVVDFAHLHSVSYFFPP